VLAGTLVAQAGFSERGQLAFVVLTAAALLGLCAIDAAAIREAARSPAVVVLVALALLTAASATWTVGDASDALRWGAVIGGYAVLAAAGYAVLRRAGVEDIAAAIVVVAVALQEEPYAERIGGAWRPGGPFEYSPALAALQLAALPAAMRWMCAPGRLRIAGAAAAALAATTLALVSSRAMLAAGVAILLWVALSPRRTVAAERGLALTAIAFVVTCGAAGDAVAGSYADPYTATADWPRLLGLALVLGLAPALWSLQARTRAPALIVVPLVAAIAAAALTPDSGAAVEPESGLTHGRAEIWGDAIETAVDGPVYGSGALTFQTASEPFQDPPPIRFAHSLVLEEWVELGYLGLAIALVLLGLAGWLVVVAPDPARWLIGTGVAVSVVASLVDWPWHVPASAAIFAFLLGALSAAPPNSS
jgi:hypothetical protein